MLTKALPLVLLAACATEVTPRPSESPTTPIAFHQDGTLVANGGTLTITIPSEVSVGWSADATNGAEVEPASGVWPNMVKPEYTLRALTPGTGTFSIATSEGIAAGTFESADVARTVIDPSCNVLLYDAQDRRLTDDSIPAQDPQCELARPAARR